MSISNNFEFFCSSFKTKLHFLSVRRLKHVVVRSMYSNQKMFILFFGLLLPTGVLAEDRWINLGFKQQLGATFYLDATSVDGELDGGFVSSSFFSYSRPFFDDELGYVGSVAELNFHDCDRDLLFSIATLFYSGKDPRAENSGFIKKVTPEELLGYPPEYLFLEFRHPVHDYICANR